MAVKSTQRLDNSRLAEFLAEKGLVEVEAIRELLQGSNEGGTPFSEALVGAKLITDWELARAVCETFHLPFLPVENCQPKPEILEGLDISFLVQHGLVPMQRFGNVLTVVMPGIVPAEILGELAAVTDLNVLPIVGTVEGNRRWLGEHCKAEESAEGDWGNLFDEGDANVQLALDDDPVEDILADVREPIEALEAELAGDLGSLEFEDGVDDVPSLTDLSAGADQDAGGVELPPIPDFGPNG